MNTFVCPECGHESTYDPWVESAHCPKCGYTPRSPLDPEEPHAEFSHARLSTRSSAPDDSISDQGGARTLGPAFTPLRRRDAKSLFKDFYKSFEQVNVDWKYVTAYAAIGLALGALVAYGTRSFFRRFGLPWKPVLGMFAFTLLGLHMMISGLRMVLTQEGWVRPIKHALRREYVTGIMAVAYGLGRTLIGLTILALGNPLTIVMFVAAMIYIMDFVR